MASDVYANAKYLMATGTLGWAIGTQVFKALLVADGYVFNHTHTYVSDVVGSEVSGGTYARIVIDGRAVIADIPGNRALFDANNAIFPNLSGVTPGGLIIYKQVGGNDLTPDNDPLVCFIDFVAVPANGLNFQVQFNGDGVMALKVC